MGVKTVKYDYYQGDQTIIVQALGEGVDTREVFKLIILELRSKGYDPKELRHLKSKDHTQYMSIEEDGNNLYKNEVSNGNNMPALEAIWVDLKN